MVTTYRLSCILTGATGDAPFEPLTWSALLIVSPAWPMLLHTRRKELPPKAQEGSPRLSWNPFSHPMECKNVAKLSREEH
jgi:hypothetical protein